MHLSDKQLTELIDSNICPICRGVTKLAEVASLVDNRIGYLCGICDYISVPDIKYSFDRFIAPGSFFVLIH